MKFLFTIWILSIALFFASLAKAETCQLSIPESYVSTFLNPPVSGHYKKCEEAPEERCFCVDSVDPWSTDLIDGELVPNSDKKFAREHSEKVARDNEKLRHEKKKSFKFTGSTIKELKEQMNEWVEMQK